MIDIPTAVLVVLGVWIVTRASLAVLYSAISVLPWIAVYHLVTHDEDMRDIASYLREVAMPFILNIVTRLSNMYKGA